MWKLWNSISIGDGECLVCFETNEACVKLDSCGHKVCRYCWSMYLQSSVEKRFDIKCCGQGCPFKINESVFRKFIQLHSSSDTNKLQDTFQKYVSNIIQPVPNLVELFSEEVVNPSSFTKKIATASASDFYHYNCCGEEDENWGCAYRDLQCIISNYNHKGIIQTEIPSLVHIQVAMDSIGHRSPRTFIGSSETEAWIEPPDVALILKDLFGIEGFQRNFEYEDLKQAEDVKQLLWQHFTDHKTPVMIDDSVKAYTIVGIRETINEQTQLLRFDPHTIQNYTYQDFKDAISLGTYGVGRTEKSNKNCFNDAGWISFEATFTSEYTKNWMMLFPNVK